MASAQNSSVQGRNKGGRPPGKQYDVNINVRLPRPALEALKLLAKRSHKSVSELVRSGVLASLAYAIPQQAEIATNEKRAARRRLEAIKNIRLITRASVYMGPDGLRLARAEALKRASRNEHNN
jgi:Arc/MetJ-type ribon-helix-helix transcriptional regulator